MPFLCFMLWVFDQSARAQSAKRIRKKTESIAMFDLKRKNQVLILQLKRYRTNERSFIRSQTNYMYFP